MSRFMKLVSCTFDQPSNTQMHLQQTLKPTGPFGLDPEIIADIEKDWVRVDQMKQVQVPSVDISILYEPIKIIPTIDGVQYPQDKFEQLIARSRLMQAHTTPPQSAAKSVGGMSPYMSPQQQQQQFNATMYGQCDNINNSPNLAEVLHKLDPNLVKIINGVSSTDTLKARAAINELNEIIDSDEKQAVLRDYEELFIQNALAQLKNLSQVPISDSLIVYQPLLSILYAFFHSKSLGKTLNVHSIKNLMTALLHLMADQKLNTNTGDDGQYNKVINGICLKILDKANFTNLNCALIRLLRETCPVAGLPKFTDLLMKCIWRNVKMLSERSNELNYDAVLLEINQFMLALPSAWWQSRPTDTPLRTIKTIIHNMAKIKGNAILDHLPPQAAHSELHTYLLRILKSLQKDGTIPTGSPQRSTSAKDLHTKRVLSQAPETMSQIFKLISDKETKQQGLQKLYEFKVQNPSIEINAFLKGASPNFHKYIEEGLAEIERTAKGDKNMENFGQTTIMSSHNTDNRFDANIQYQTTTTPPTGSGNIKSDPDYWMDRLNHLRAKANLAPHRNADGSYALGTHLLDNKVADENLNLNTLTAGQKVSLIRNDRTELSPNRLQHIQAKLALLKKENNS